SFVNSVNSNFIACTGYRAPDCWHLVGKRSYVCLFRKCHFLEHRSCTSNCGFCLPL
ncbi:hypothetical protein CRM22_003211, partial [Opisthorchis felineus]